MLAYDVDAAKVSTMGSAVRCRKVAIIVASLALAACSSSSGLSSSGPPVPSPEGMSLLYKVGSPIGLAQVAGRVWAVSATRGAVTPLGAGPADTPVFVHVGTTPLRATYYRHLLWVTVFGAGQVVAVDPSTSTVVRRVTVTGQPEGIVAAYGRIWVVRQAARRLTAITPHGRVLQSVALGREPRLVTAGDHSLFVSNFDDGTVTRVNPRSGAAITSPRLCRGVQGLATDQHTLWVACTTSGEVIAVNPATLRRTGRVELDDEPDAVRVADGHVFVASTKGPTLHEIGPDPHHPTVLRSRTLGAALPLFDRANVDLAVIGDQFWVSSPDRNRVIRVQW
jgi:hypothetical protein